MQSPSRSRWQDDTKKRVRFLAALMTVVLSFYLLYLFSLQVLDGSIYAARARQISERFTTIPAQRGRIYDRNFKLLATDVPSYSIDIIPAEAARYGLKPVLRRLSKLLKVSAASLQAHLPAGWQGIYQPVKIQGGVPFSTITYIAEHDSEFPGVSWQSRPVRKYLGTGSISHIVGYVGDITQQELQILYNKGYSATSIVGKDGVEEEYDSLLRGRPGQELDVVDANGRPVPGKRRIVRAPSDGKDIVLTVNSRWQKLAEMALGPRTGSVIILRPSTGAVLAMVSYPWYNSNLLSGKGASAALNKILLDPRFPFINRAIQSSYAPASTFKIIMATADYQTKLLSPTKLIDTTGSMVYGGRVWHDWKPTGFGPIDLKMGLAHSSDQYFWILGTQYLGIQREIKYARMFGLGRKTGIDLPGEVTGLVPTPKWKQRTLHQPWVGGDTMDNSIGQGYMQVTPIQMADVGAMVINKGVVYRPHVLKEVINPNTGHVIRTYKPQVILHPKIPKHVFTEVQKAMRANATIGTARYAITERVVKIASKTGTGQSGIHHHWSSWFVSFAPYGAKNPDNQIEVVVMVESTNTWQWWGPKAADIIYQGLYGHERFWQAIHSLEPVWFLNNKVVGPFDR